MPWLQSVAINVSSDELVALDLTIAKPNTARTGSSVPTDDIAARSASVCELVRPETPAGSGSPASGHGARDWRTVEPALSAIFSRRKLHEPLSGIPLSEKEILPSESAIAVVEALAAAWVPSDWICCTDTVYVSPDVRASTEAGVIRTAAHKIASRTPGLQNVYILLKVFFILISLMPIHRFR
jgi:hypothetical protein